MTFLRPIKLLNQRKHISLRMKTSCKRFIKQEVSGIKGIHNFAILQIIQYIKDLYEIGRTQIQEDHHSGARAQRAYACRTDVQGSSLPITQ